MNETVPAQTGRFRELHYVQVGQGRPVIALHGFGQTSYSWRHLAAALPNDTALYAFDLRGCGASAKPRDEHYALRDQAALICAFIGERDLKDVTLVGHSMGGGIALLAALDLISQANRLRSLVLIGSIAYPLGIPWFMRLMRTPWLGRVVLACLPPRLLVQIIMRQAFYDPGKIEAAAVGAYARNLASPDGRYALLKTAQYIIPADLDRITASYARINVPTLIIWGSDDRIIPFETGSRLNAAIAKSRLRTVPACGHIPQEERPDLAIPMIRAFLADAAA
jgi:pimeloyl-ACP methyl ester carboxylesterase